LDDGFVVCCFSVTFPQKPQSQAREREREREKLFLWAGEKEQPKKEEVVFAFAAFAVNNHIQLGMELIF